MRPGKCFALWHLTHVIFDDLMKVPDWLMDSSNRVQVTAGCSWSATAGMQLAGIMTVVVAARGNRVAAGSGPTRRRRRLPRAA